MAASVVAWPVAGLRFNSSASSRSAWVISRFAATLENCIVGLKLDGLGRCSQVFVEFLRDSFGIFTHYQTSVGRLVKKFSCGTEVLPDLIHLVNQVRQEFQIGVVFACEVENMNIPHLSVAVKATITLLQP